MTGKRGYVVRFGRRRSALMFLAACITASLLFVLIYVTGALGEDVELGLIALISLIPLGIAGYTAAVVSDKKEKVLSQVKLNFASLVIFLLLMGLVLTGD